MFLTLAPEQFKTNNILFSEKVDNKVINNSDFYRIIYSDDICVMSGLHIHFDLVNINIERYFNKIKCCILDNNNTAIIQILKERFPNIREPQKEDICYATTNRQMAVKNIAKNCDMFFVIGSRNSSNSVRLVEVAKKSGCLNSQLIHSQSKIPYDLIKNSKTIGISSGASAPEILVENFINDLKKKFTVSIDEVEIIKEDVVFKVPKKLN